MNDQTISEIAKVLSTWNPLGPASDSVSDLDGYKTEAEDIFFALETLPNSISVVKVVQDVLNQAFNLALDEKACRGPADRIASVLKKRKH